jgi:hypothetical protein
MNTHRIKHGDVVKSTHVEGTYRVYLDVASGPDNLMCYHLNTGTMYRELKYKAGWLLADGEEFVFNLFELCANNTR